MNPPLRGARDRDAVIEALKDGTLDCLATDISWEIYYLMKEKDES